MPRKLGCHRSPKRAAACLLGAATLTLAAGCNREDVATVGTEREANEILVRLAQNDVARASVEASKGQRTSSFAISVPTGSVQRARQVLLQYNLPREARPGLDAIVQQEGLLPTESDQRLKKTFALCSELERTFESIDGIVQARVHVNLPAPAGLSRDPSTKPAPASAAVLLKYDPATWQPASAGKGLVAAQADAKAGDAKAGAPARTLDADAVRNIVRQSVDVPGGSDADIAIYFDPATVFVPAPVDSAHLLERFPGGQDGAMIALIVSAVGALGMATWNGLIVWKRDRD